MRTVPSPSSRVLCITLRAGSVGHAALDGFGVVPGSFFTTRLDHLRPTQRPRAIFALVRSSIARFTPARIVIGLPGALRPDRLALATRLIFRLKRLGISAAVRRLRDAAGLFVEHVRYTMADELVERLGHDFVPDLAAFVPRTKVCPQYWRVAWYAVAVALSVLLDHHPYEMAALASPAAFRHAPFQAALARAVALSTYAT